MYSKLMAAFSIDIIPLWGIAVCPGFRTENV
jgi:hypothetical protein